MDELEAEMCAGYSGANEEAEIVTAADVLKKLEEAWMNEKLSPDILEHQTDVIDCMLEQINGMEKNLTQVKRGGDDLRTSIHKLEIDRIKYLISSYLKTRLKKIETYCAEILERDKILVNSDKEPRLSAEEMQFAKSYFSVIDGHMKKVALSRMPPNMQALDAVQTMPKPNLDGYVFLRATKRVPGVLLDEGEDRDELIDLEEGSQHLLPFKSIVHLLNDGSVSLI